MRPRVLGSVLLALLAWIPAQRGRTWALRGTAQERIAVSVSALDVATDSPARAQTLKTPDHSARRDCSSTTSIVAPRGTVASVRLVDHHSIMTGARRHGVRRGGFMSNEENRRDETLDADTPS
jgi:hypothetical protein